MARLGDICDILDNKRVPITASNRLAGPYPYYGANGVQDYVADYIFDDELVLLAEDGGNFGSKDKPIAYRVSGKCWVNNHAHVLKPKEGLDVDYLCYSLMFYDVTGLVNGATRQKLTQADMRKMEIPLPPLDEQRKIAAVLDKVSDLIAKRRQQLDKLDTLVKARFVEMFGDVNSSRYPIVNLVDIAEDIFAGGDKPADVSLTKDDTYKYPVYANGYEKQGFQCYAKTYKVAKAAVTISARGTIGYCFIREPFFTPVIRLITVVPDGKISIMYLKYAIDSINFEISGTSQAQLTVPDFKKKRIVLPPVDIQDQFSSFVTQVDKSKLSIQKSCEKLETLKKALMQQYFG